MSEFAPHYVLNQYLCQSQRSATGYGNQEVLLVNQSFLVYSSFHLTFHIVLGIWNSLSSLSTSLFLHCSLSLSLFFVSLSPPLSLSLSPAPRWLYATDKKKDFSDFDKGQKKTRFEYF